MKFDEKYPTAPPLTSIDAFLMRGLLEYACTICQEPTNWIYLPASVPACSEECVDGKWKLLEAAGRREDTREKMQGATCFVCERSFGSSVDSTRVSVWAHRVCLGDVDEPITPVLVVKQPEKEGACLSCDGSGESSLDSDTDTPSTCERCQGSGVEPLKRPERRVRGRKMSEEEKKEFEEWKRSRQEVES